MQIAEVLVKQGMAAGDSFKQALTDIVAKHEITRIIETGTYQGTGTTRAILDGIKRHGKSGVEFVSIEANRLNYHQARKNLQGEPVRLLYGLSIPNGLRPEMLNVFTPVDRSYCCVCDRY